ncbi:glycosyltransferase family 4 protein [Methyloglobulus sp.]|uniref:glycosyltransferase family 4 protein n=1 Tax=Methyloglobulus sp. TaxID=2518622 RepID=UPI003988D7AE
MKILLTVHQFFPQYAAGTEVLTLSVARELITRGYEVHVLTGHPGIKELQDEDRFDEYDFEGIHVYRFHHAYTPMAGQISMIEVGYDNQLAAKYFGQILEKFKPGVVHFFHLNRLGTGLIEHAVRAGIPCFMTPTDFWSICPTGQLVLGDGKLCSGPSAYAGNCVKHFAQSTKKGWAGKVAQWLPTVAIDLLVRLTQAEIMPPYPQQVEVKAISSRLAKNVTRLNQLSKIISPNSFMTEKLIKFGVSPELIVQSAFGVEVPKELIKVDRQSLRQPFRVGYIGTLAPHKGCHILIDAFKALPGGKAILKIYGNLEDLPEYSCVLKRFADTVDNIEFCGIFHNSKISEVLADLDVLVVPSLWYENTPLVVYSAQAANCPVIASDLPGISEVIRDQVNGLLFETGNVEELAKRLSRFIGEPDLVSQLSTNAVQPKSTVTYVDELSKIWEGK